MVLNVIGAATTSVAGGWTFGSSTAALPRPQRPRREIADLGLVDPFAAGRRGDHGEVTRVPPQRGEQLVDAPRRVRRAHDQICGR
jgi:hypothetical protein